MKIRTNVFLIVIVLSFTVLSCSKSKDDDAVRSNKEILTSKTWKYLSIAYDGVQEELSDCEKDDLLTLATNGTWLYSVNETPCEDQSDDTGTWTLSSDEKQLTLVEEDEEPWTIVEINESKLTLSVTYDAETTVIKFTAK